MSEVLIPQEPQPTFLQTALNAALKVIASIRDHSPDGPAFRPLTPDDPSVKSVQLGIGVGRHRHGSPGSEGV